LEGSIIFPKILLNKFILKRDKKWNKLFFYRGIAPKFPAVITPLMVRVKKRDRDCSKDNYKIKHQRNLKGPKAGR
jgi:hypothetical protein